MKNSILDFRTLLSIGQDKYTGKVGKEVKKNKSSDNILHFTRNTPLLG